MKTLDLHKMKHEDAKREVEYFINENWGLGDRSYRLKIITGHSPEMRKIATDMLDRYALTYFIGGPLGLLGDSCITI